LIPFVTWGMKKRLLFFLLLPLFAPAQRPIDVQHYRFEVELSDATDAINGTATLTVTFLKDAAQLELDLMKGSDEKGMYVFEAREESTRLRTQHNGSLLVLNLATPAKAGETRRFTIQYMGTPSDGLIISRNRHGDRTFFSDHWPNRAQAWLPCNDHPSDKASVEFVVTAPARYQVVSNGQRIEEKAIDGARKRTHWKETAPLSTKIMAMGAAPFAVRNYAPSEGGVPVSAWVYPQDSTALFFDYGAAPSILRFFADYIGAPFPFSKLANVQSTTIFGGMENAGAIFYAENAVTGKRGTEELIAHEIAHQWFGDAVSEKSFAHLWLSEGFATALANIYIGHRFGADSARRRREADREAVLRFVQTSNRPVVDSTEDLMSLLNANSYQKGGWVLFMLQQEVGDSLFRRILQTHYQRYRGGNADTRDFQAVVEEVCGRSFRTFFDQWLYRPGVPQLQIETKQEEGMARIRIRQAPPYYQLPIEIGIIGADGKMSLELLPLQGGEVEWKAKDRSVKRIVVDPNSRLLYRERKG
jgi:aminopeptidase N